MNPIRRLAQILIPISLHAQRNGDSDAACAMCGTACGAYMFLLIGLFVLNIILLVWVAKDAKARSMDNAILWMLLVFFLGLFGLLIYLLVRPKGALIPCSSCGNRRLEVSAKCPHCANA